MKLKTLEIYAKIEAIKIEVMGMVTENKEREINGEAIAYSERLFVEAAKEISKLIDEIIEIDLVEKKIHED